MCNIIVIIMNYTQAKDLCVSRVKLINSFSFNASMPLLSKESLILALRLYAQLDKYH